MRSCVHGRTAVSPVGTTRRPAGAAQNIQSGTGRANPCPDGSGARNGGSARPARVQGRLRIVSGNSRAMPRRAPRRSTSLGAARPCRPSGRGQGEPGP
jgi:hypothetical protein